MHIVSEFDLIYKIYELMTMLATLYAAT